MELWSAALSDLRKRLNRQTYETWFRATRPVSQTDGRLVVEVPNEFCRELLASNYLPLLQQIVSDMAHRRMEIDLVVARDGEAGTPGPEPEPAPPAPPLITSNGSGSGKFLNPNYTFENFVVGDSNGFANAAAVAVAERPATAYNPLFMYGGVGLGKTHLMHAIGHRILQANKGLKLIYVSSEAFTNEVILSIQENRMADFRRKYRQVDVLMIDDIQFIANKDATQTEFFHTFNALYEKSRQVVISSDTCPKDLQNMEARLVSRFGCGLVADIQPPALETKVAILEKKAEARSFRLPYDVALFIAGRIKSNIRDLEGALTRLVAYSGLMGQEPTIEFAGKVLRDLLQEEERVITVEVIQREVGRHFDVKPSALKGRARTKSIAFPRQVAMFLCRELTNLSLPDIGQKFGGKDHTTVLYAVRKIEEDMNRDPLKRKAVEQLRGILAS